MIAQNGSTTDAIIQFHGVNKWFGKLHVLQDINFSVGEGEKVVIAGPSGSGKSTLIRCINHLEPIDRGELTVDGIRASDPKVDVNALRARIGMVFQQFNLFPHLTAAENVMLAPSNRDASCSTECTFPRRRTSIQRSYPAGSSSAWPSLVVWQCTPRSCSSTSQLPRSIRR